MVNTNKFKIFCLGGFSEIAKNCFFIEYNNEIVIFNYGNYPSPNNNLGINIKIPNINYLLEKKSNIKAIFFTNMSENNIGGYRYFFSKIKVPIYASKLTIDWLKSHDKGGEIFKNIEFHRIENKKTINFNYFKVTPFTLNSNIFNSFNYLIEHDCGKVFYLNDYYLNFEPKTMIPAKILDDLRFLLSPQNHNNNDILLSSASGFLKKQFACFNSSLNTYFFDIFNNHPQQRIFLSIYNYDFLAIKQLIHLATSLKRSIFFVNKKFFDFLKFLEENKHFSFNNGAKIIHDFDNIENNTIIFFTGKNPKILKDILLLIYSPKKIKINKNDVFVSLTKPIPGFELLGVEIFNEFIKQNINFYFLPKNLENSYPSKFDILTVLRFINPRYFVPLSVPYNTSVEIVKNINNLNLGCEGLLLENGDSLEIYKNVVTTIHKTIDTDSLFLQSFQQSLITNDILTERIVLLNNGIFVVSCGINFQKNKISTNIDFQGKGIDLQGNKVLKEKIKDVIVSNIETKLKTISQSAQEVEKFKEILTIQAQIKKTIKDLIYSAFKKSPMIEIAFFVI